MYLVVYTYPRPATFNGDIVEDHPRFIFEATFAHFQELTNILSGILNLS